jgi:hypothetical protein
MRDEPEDSNDSYDIIEFNEEERAEASPAATERRLWRNLLLMSVLVTVGVFWRWGSDIAVSVSLGCALGILNYRWMHSSLRGIVAASGGEPPSRFQLAKFFLRWLVVGGVLFFASRVAQLSVVAVVCGLFVLPLTVVVETFFQVAYLPGRRAAK